MPHVDIEVDRWVLKALVEIGSREDHKFFSDAAKSSTDDENRLWAFAGLIKVSSAEEFQGFRDSYYFPSIEYVLLAACYAGKPNLVTHASPIKIENASRVVLLWACLCFAFGRSREGVFDPKFDQIEQLSELNLHHDFVVSQYSIYAMGMLDGVTFSQSKLKLHELSSKEESVRKWGYQLILKESHGLSKNMDFWNSVVSNETSDVALEGFAIGIKEQHTDGVSELVSKLLVSDTAVRLELNLLDHMCKFADIEEFYKEVVEDAFGKQKLGSAYRSRCYEASRGTPLYKRLKQLEIGNEHKSLFGDGQQMTTTNFNIGSIGQSTISVGDNNTIKTQGQGFDLLVREFSNSVSSVTGAEKKDMSDEEQNAYANALILKNDPSKENVERFIDGVEKIQKITDGGSKILSNLTSIASNILPYLPN
jgi:hypothetical protein